MTAKYLGERKKPRSSWGIQKVEQNHRVRCRIEGSLLKLGRLLHCIHKIRHRGEWLLNLQLMQNRQAQFFIIALQELHTNNSPRFPKQTQHTAAARTKPRSFICAYEMRWRSWRCSTFSASSSEVLAQSWSSLSVMPFQCHTPSPRF